MDAAVGQSSPIDDARPLRLRRWPALVWGVLAFLLAAGITLLLWQRSLEASANARELQFRLAANAIVNEITDQLGAHTQTLWGAAGFIAANPNPTRQQWRAYVDALQMPERLPGARAIGFAKRVSGSERDAHVQTMRAAGFPNFTIHPPGERDEYAIISLVEPFDDRNGSALGLDFWSLPRRRPAMEQARDRGAPAITPRVVLAREPNANGPPGFLMFVPVFAPGAALGTIEGRRAALIGFTYSPFRAADFISNRLVAEHTRQAGAAFEIYDGTVASEQNLLFRSRGFPAEADPRQTITIAEVIAGRTWTFRLTPLPTFGIKDAPLPRLILIAGLMISLLAGTVVGGFAFARTLALESNRRLLADVERRQRVETQLRDSERKFHDLFDNLPLPAFAMDRATLRYFAVNEAAVKKYGFSHEEFAQMRITDLRPPEEVPGVLSFMESVRDAPGYAGEFRHRTRDGRLMDVQITAHTIDLHNRPTTIVIAQDITERKRAEQALLESEQRIQQSQKLEAIGQLTGGIAHDFNNILTVITGTIEILADGVAHDPLLASITRLIDDAAHRGADLTRDLLSFARRQPLQPRAIEINTLVVGASKLFRSTLGEDIEIVSRLGDNLWPAYVDASQLTTALLNLALNARDAMTGGGKLVLETGNVWLDEAYATTNSDARAGAYVMVAISDTGAGIPADIVGKVFEPFFTTKDVGKGTGLGLSMVYGFVKQSDGHIKIYSEQGYGTTIKIYLPRAEQHQIIEDDDEAPLVPSGGGETVLAVEDDDLVRHYVTAQLRSLGYETLVASNSAEALRIVAAGASFDLLFTDVVMPGGMNGPALAETVLKQRPGVRVLFTSGYTEHAAVSGGRLDPGMPLLNKPYRKADLARRLRQVLDGPPQTAA